MASYTYDPTRILQGGKDQMRFELGDTDVSAAGISSVLCDEEYTAIIQNETSWRRAKVKCLEAIVMRFAHLVNVSVDGLSYSYQARWDFWKNLVEEERRKNPAAVPTANRAALASNTDGGHYFYNDMMHNPDYKGGRHV